MCCTSLVWVIVLFLWGSVVRRFWTLGDCRVMSEGSLHDPQYRGSMTSLGSARSSRHGSVMSLESARSKKWVYDVPGVCILRQIFFLRHTLFLTFRSHSVGYFSICMFVFCTFFWSFWHFSFCLHDLFCSWSFQCACFLTTVVMVITFGYLVHWWWSAWYAYHLASFMWVHCWHSWLRWGSRLGVVAEFIS